MMQNIWVEAMITIIPLKIFTPYDQLVIAQITRYELTMRITLLASTQFRVRKTAYVELEKRKPQSNVESPVYMAVFVKFD